MPLDDIQYLHEYAEFSGHGPDHVVDALLATIDQARAARSYDVVALLIARLHAEMVTAMETAGALLRAYSQWSTPGGIIGAMLSYRPGEVPDFVDGLLNAPDSLLLLRLPTLEALRQLQMAHDVNLEDYNCSELDRMVHGFCTLYCQADVRNTYNKVKHGGMYVRHPMMIQAAGTGIVENDEVYVLLSARVGEPPVFAGIPVVGERGLNMARRYVHNTKVVTRISRTFALFVARCLQERIMR